MPTVEILVYNSKGKVHKARGLLDSASQSNFISNSLAKRLSLKLKELNVNVRRINRGQAPVRYQTQFKIVSSESDNR